MFGEPANAGSINLSRGGIRGARSDPPSFHTGADLILCSRSRDYGAIRDGLTRINYEEPPYAISAETVGEADYLIW